MSVSLQSSVTLRLPVITMASNPPRNPPRHPPRPPSLAEHNAAAPGRVIKKRKNLDYAVKFEIVKLIDRGETKRSVGKKFGINESTVRGIYNDREKIKTHMNVAPTESVSQAKRSRNQLLLKTEHLLGRYLERQAKSNVAVDTKDVVDTAKEIYVGLARKQGVRQPPLFLASKGWVDNFMTRHKVKSVKICGEAASGDMEAARKYPEELKNIIDAGQYTPDQIFNMDETNFYWKMLPQRTFITTKSAKVRGRKAIKERFTLLFAMNASGSCRLKPTVVHRAKRPRAYKGCNMQKLNVHWMTSRKGYMSAKLSQDWLKDAFISEVEEYCRESNIRFNILLLLDNAPGHSPLLRTQHPNVRVEFLPPNTTSMIQPLDQEVIAVVKAAYSTRQFRKMRQATEDTALIQQLIENDNENEAQNEDLVQGDTESEKKVVRYWKNYNIKEAIDLMVDCWDKVTPATINHAWRNILEGLPQDRQVVVVGELQSVEAEVRAAVEEARGIPGGGFSDTTSDDIQEMIRPVPVTADDIIEEDNLAQDEDKDDDDDDEGVMDVRREGLSMSEIKKLIDLGNQMSHILEQDSTINSEEKCFALNKVLAGYKDQYNAHINTLQQRQITDFLRCRNDAQPTRQPEPNAEVSMDDETDFAHDFEGFTDETLLDEIERRRGGQ